MRGRKPKPTWLKIVSGNPGGRPLNRDEPAPDGDLKEPPHWFSPRQRILWDQCIAAAPAGLLKLIDSSVLIMFVVAMGEHEIAAQKIVQYGSVVKMPDTGEAQRSPYVGILNQQAAVMLKCAAEMGFTPSSRSRVKVAGNKKADNTFNAQEPPTSTEHVFNAAAHNREFRGRKKSAACTLPRERRFDFCTPYPVGRSVQG